MQEPESRRRARRLVVVAAFIIVAYAAFVATIPLTVYREDPRPPSWILRSAGLFILLSLPAALALVGAARSAAPVTVVAAVICLFQSFVAFSGVTLGYLVPAILLFAVAAYVPKAGEEMVPGGPSLVALVLAVGGWFALISMTEPRCYAGGCSSAETTIPGVVVTALLALGAVAVVSRGPRRA